MQAGSIPSYTQHAKSTDLICFSLFVYYVTKLICCDKNAYLFTAVGQHNCLNIIGRFFITADYEPRAT